MSGSRVWTIAFGLGVVVAGCSKPPTAKPPAPKPKASLAVENAGAELTQYSSGPNRRALWRVQWKEAMMTVVGETPTIGTMKDVTGDIYQAGQSPKKFRADQAVADRKSNVLTLSGKVSIYAPDQKANMKCDKVVWYGEREVLDGEGNVSLVTDRYSLTGLNAVEARPDFSVVATPDMFTEGHGKG